MVSESENGSGASPQGSPRTTVPPPLTDSSSPSLLGSSRSQSFSAIAEKLDSENYLLWCQQVEPVIKAHKLHHFLVNPSIPLKFKTVADSDANRISPEYEAWEQQDQLLLAWLQSTISRDMLRRVIGCKHSWQLWDRIHAYFQTHVNAKLCHLRSELRHTKLEGSVSEFLLKIQSLVGSIHAIGESVSYREHLDVILEGLPRDYESTISLISGKFGTVSIEEVESLLLGHEARLERFKKDEVPSINLAASSVSQTQEQDKDSTSQTEFQNYSKPYYGSGDRGRRHSRGGRGGRGLTLLGVCLVLLLEVSLNHLHCPCLITMLIHLTTSCPPLVFIHLFLHLGLKL